MIFGYLLATSTIITHFCLLCYTTKIRGKFPIFLENRSFCSVPLRVFIGEVILLVVCLTSERWYQDLSFRCLFPLIPTVRQMFYGFTAVPATVLEGICLICDDGLGNVSFPAVCSH